jgi:hypothetical protein
MMLIPGHPDIVAIPTRTPLDEVSRQLRLYGLYRRAVVLRADLIDDPGLPAIHGGSHARDHGCRELWRDLAREHLISCDRALGMPARRLPSGADAVISALDQALAAIERQIDLEPGGHATVLLNAYFP